MKHLGDITKIKGSEVAPVNAIIAGSPCQGLSIAGKGLGLNDERSGLFMEQIRLIKEMREEDAKRGRKGKDIRPRFMVWENVPGAFSSNKGADFGAVLQETIKVVCKEAPAVPMPKNGWPTSGCLTDVAGKWSVAWRVFDAQFFGVPQRRRRITLIADFGGLSAPEILFERESVSGNSSQSRTPWEILTRNAESGIGTASSAIIYNGETITSKVNASNPKIGDPCHTLGATGAGRCYCVQGNCIDRADTAGCNGKGWTEDKSYTLNTMDRHAVALSNVASTLRAGAGAPKHESDMLGGLCLSPRNGTTYSQDAYDKYTESDIAASLKNSGGNYGGGSEVLAVKYQSKNGKSYLMRMRSGCDGGGKGPLIQEEKSGTLATGNDQTLFAPYNNVCMATQQGGAEIRTDGIAPTLTAAAGMSGNNQPVYCAPMASGIDGYNATLTGEKSATLGVNCGLSTGRNGVCDCTSTQDFIVRRLTPLECERLQGFPDGWTQIGEVVDYKRHQEFDPNGTLVSEWVEAIYEYIDCNGKKRKTTDSARYKALGNSIALPPWFWVLARLSLACGADVTMASLFDGIGGFPLIWQTLNGEGTCLWASEIEEFPIAVTQQRINGDK